jgi:hypothetical protein
MYVRTTAGVLDRARTATNDPLGTGRRFPGTRHERIRAQHEQ